MINNYFVIKISSYSFKASIKSLNVVREHFEKYPLQTTKDVHFRL